MVAVRGARRGRMSRMPARRLHRVLNRPAAAVDRLLRLLRRGAGGGDGAQKPRRTSEKLRRADARSTRSALSTGYSKVTEIPIRTEIAGESAAAEANLGATLRPGAHDGQPSPWPTRQRHGDDSPRWLGAPWARLVRYHGHDARRPRRRLAAGRGARRRRSASRALPRPRGYPSLADACRPPRADPVDVRRGPDRPSGLPQIPP